MIRCAFIVTRREFSTLRGVRAASEVPDRRLPDAVRETAIAAGSGAVFKTGVEFAGTGEAGAGDQRHRMRSPDERGQGQVAVAMPDVVVAEVQIAEAVEMMGPTAVRDHELPFSL